MYGAQAVDELALGVVRLRVHAVEAFVRAELDVAGVVARLQQLFDAGVVTGFGGTDEVVVSNTEPPPRGAELFGDAVGVREGRQSFRFGGALDLQPVFVCAGEEVDVITEETVPARERVA